MDGHTLNEKKLKKELHTVPAAIPYCKKANTSKIISISFIPPTVLFAFLGRQNTDIGSPGFGKNRTGFAIAGILSSGTILFFIARSLKNLKKAISIHNEKLRAVY
jgi:hypothetical protein